MCLFIGVFNLLKNDNITFVLSSLAEIFQNVKKKEDTVYLVNFYLVMSTFILNMLDY